MSINMKITIIILGILSLKPSDALKKTNNDAFDKRETTSSITNFMNYPSSSHSSHALQIQPALSRGNEGSAISIGAGYSVAGAKPQAYTFSPQVQPQYVAAGNIHPATNPQPYQLAPITLNPGQGQQLVSSDLNQLMSQLNQQFASGALNLQSLQSSPSIVGQSQIGVPQYTFAMPKIQQYSVTEATPQYAPSYQTGKSLSAFGSTGPVLFNPAADQAAAQPSYNFALKSNPSHIKDASSSFPGLDLGNYNNAFGSFPSLSHSLAGAGAGHNIQSFGNNHGPVVSNKYFTGSNPHKVSSLKNPHGHNSQPFKPSAFLGSSPSETYGNSAHSQLSGQPGSDDTNNQAQVFSDGHGSYSISSTKYAVPSYLSKFESLSSQFDSSNHLSTNPSSLYGDHSASFGVPAGQTVSQQYFVSPAKHSSSSLSDNSALFKSPNSPSHSSLSSVSRFNLSPTTRFQNPKDSNGGFSESAYNTIKYSEHAKPRGH